MAPRIDWVSGSHVSDMKERLRAIYNYSNVMRKAEPGPCLAAADTRNEKEVDMRSTVIGKGSQLPLLGRLIL